MLNQVIAVALFGALGCVSRFLLCYRIQLWFPKAFPYGTLTVNVIGSFLIGFLSIFLTSKLPLSATWRAGILIGFLGGFTTFSGFSLNIWDLLRYGYIFQALVYVIASVLLCFSATCFGIYLGKL